jgi:hypothetical protein
MFRTYIIFKTAREVCCVPNSYKNIHRTKCQGERWKLPLRIFLTPGNVTFPTHDIYQATLTNLITTEILFTEVYQVTKMRFIIVGERKLNVFENSRGPQA